MPRHAFPHAAFMFKVLNLAHHFYKVTDLTMV